MIRTFTASGAITQYYFCKGTTTDGEVAVASANDSKILGINNLAAASGDSVDVCLPGEMTWLKLSGTVAAGDTLMPHTDGTGRVATTTKCQGALALENGVTGDIIEVLVIRATTF